MPTFTLRKFLLSALVFFVGTTVQAQEKAIRPGVGKENFTTFTTKTRQPDAVWINFNNEQLNSPDATIEPMVADPAGMIELYNRRTRSTKYFINPSKPSEFVQEQSSGSIHYLKDGHWATIDTRLKPLSTNIFEASRQEEPVGFDIQRKESFIKATKENVSFNKWELYGKNAAGAIVLLATAKWTNHTIGDDGLSIQEIFPGIDATMSARKGAIKTNFIIRRNQFAGYTQLIFKDAFQSTNAGNLSFANGSIQTNTYAGDVNYKAAGQEILHIRKGVAYTQTSDPNNIGYRNLTYTIAKNQLSVNVDASYINTQLAYGAVVVDPFVEAVSTLAQASITGSMNCGSITNSCNYTIPVTPPSGATITAVQIKFSFWINAPLLLNQAAFAIVAPGGCGSTTQIAAAQTTPATTGVSYVYTPDSVNTLNIAGFWDALSATLLPCMPAASCPPPVLPFTLRFWNTYCAAGPTGCSNLYAFAREDFSVRVRGNTLTGTPITRSSNVTICAGQSVTLTRTPPSGGVAPFRYSWSPGGQTTSSIVVSPTVTTLYTSTITDTCGNVSIDTTTVKVLNPSIPPTVVSPLNICQFDPPTPLTAVGTNLVWFTTLTGGSPLPSAPIPPVTVPGTYNYYVAQSNMCGASPRAQITVIVRPKPAPPNVVSPLGLCQYDVVNLSATGQNLRWYYTPTGGAPGVPSITVPTAYEDSLYYYVTQNVGGCESDRARLRVFVSYKPNGVVLPTRLAVCEGELDSFNYFGNATPPQAIFNWSTANGINRIISGQGTTGPVIVRFDSAGQHQVRVQVNNRGCLSELASQPVTVRANPRITFNVKEDGCQGEIVTIALSGITPKIDSFKYNFPGGTVIYGAGSGGPYGVRYNTPGPKVISSMAFTRGCPSRLYDETINIHPLPDVGFTAQKTGICAGDSVLLTVRNGDSTTQYYWTPGYFYASGNIYSAWGVIEAGGYVKLRAVSKWGCENSDSILIDAKPCCEMFFPNAFSPNNDTHNDVFRPVTNGHQDIKTFRIINRWGQVVYETRGDRMGWDGVYNGKPQDVGTYYYYIRYRCSEGREDIEQKGEVLLIR